MSFLNKDLYYAIVGATTNPEKYGYKVMKDLQVSGYKVIPVNPNSSEILGERAYQKLADILQTIDAVFFIVPPAVTEQVLHDVSALGIKKVWLQPGSESGAAISFCQDNNINCVHHACIMMSEK